MARRDVEILRVEWTGITGATVATLVGPVDESATDIVVGIRLLAKDIERVLVDLSRVVEIDEPGIVLLDALSHVPNIGLVHPSDAVIDARERFGHHAF